MKRPISWNEEKNLWLRETRGFGFEDVVAAIDDEAVLDDLEHPSPRYAHQRMLVVRIGGDAVLVPYLTDETGSFLKTAYASRKYRRVYLGDTDDG